MSLIDKVTEYYQERALLYDDTAGYLEEEAEKLRFPIKERYREIFAGHNVLEIACGTGYWTSIIGEVAKSVLAIDNNSTVIAQAKNRCKHQPNVKFQLTEAYTLENVPAGFSSAFGNWWWSHIPVEKITEFLTVLHSRLLPGALVLFVDKLRYEGVKRRKDAAGNTIEQRSLPDGRVFEIVKNFPEEKDIYNILSDIADNIQYIERPDEESWNLIYNVKK